METQNVKKRMHVNGKCIILACSGASKMGNLTDKIARRLNNSDSYSMSCLAKVAAHDSVLMNSLQQNEALVIDGCKTECAKKIMEEAWLSNYQYINLNDIEFIRNNNLESENIENLVYDHINNLSDVNIVEHQRPIQLKDCTEETCDMFDFMSKYVGLKVLHPGGTKATKQFVDILQPKTNTKVLDIACGKGRTSVYLAKKYGCKVVGIDILEESIEEARRYAAEKKVDHLVSFQVADAQKLPFDDNEFDITIAQAMLILVPDKYKVVREASRVTKPGGKSGWMELSWKKEPTQKFLKDATEGICAMCISNVITFNNWEKIMYTENTEKVEVHRFNMASRGLMGMMQDEGFINGLKVMVRFIMNPKIRKRMKKLNTFFNAYPEYTGYGIYISSKKV